MNNFKHNSEENYIEIIQRLVKAIVVLLLIIVVLLVYLVWGGPTPKKEFPKKDLENETKSEKEKSVPDVWTAPDTTQIKTEKNAAQIIYGRELIANTSFYLGPKGKVQHTTNGMNCQNCHLEAGTKPFGNNYSAVASLYPKFRERSGTKETIYKRVNDCIERSLNGIALDSLSNEMQSIVAYIKWVGKDVPKGEKPKGSGITELAFLDRAADPEKGKTIYMLKCKTCHLENGEGKFNSNQLTYQYPPLWGEHSYNKGAGLLRLSRFAGYVKSNMPQNTTFDSPQLTDEEAWDVAAYVNSQPRPEKDLSKDWPKISDKPVDHPFGPFTDKFSEQQHKYGPFGPIADARKKTKK